MVVTNYKLNKKLMMQGLIGKQIKVEFILPTGETIHPLIDIIERREGEEGQGYFLSTYQIQLPLKCSTPERYKGIVRVEVPKGSSIESQLKEKGFLK